MMNSVTEKNQNEADTGESEGGDGASAIDIVGRGFEAHVATPFDGPMIDSSCVFCGSCVQVCPTAALNPVSRMGKGREWELDRVRTICSYCGVGCARPDCVPLPRPSRRTVNYAC